MTVYTRQRPKGNNHLYKMPLECRFTDGASDVTQVITIDAPTNSFNFTLPFNPTWIALDRDEKISDAITDQEMIISSTGTKTFAETNTAMNVLNAGSGSSTIRVEHNWVAPDPVKNSSSKLRVSDFHYSVLKRRRSESSSPE